MEFSEVKDGDQVSNSRVFSFTSHFGLQLATLKALFSLSLRLALEGFYATSKQWQQTARNVSRAYSFNPKKVSGCRSIASHDLTCTDCSRKKCIVATARFRCYFFFTEKFSDCLPVTVLGHVCHWTGAFFILEGHFGDKGGTTPRTE